MTELTKAADDQSLVYFISANKTEHPIKIGKSTGRALRSRMKVIQTGLPTRLVVLHVAEAPPTVERMLHHEFRRHRLHGEWFEWCFPILDYIESLELEAGPGWRQKYDVADIAFKRSVFGDGREGRRNVNQMFGMGLSG